MTVYLLWATGADEGIIGVYTTREKAEAAQAYFQRDRHFGGPLGPVYREYAEIQEWKTDNPELY